MRRISLVRQYLNQRFISPAAAPEASPTLDGMKVRGLPTPDGGKREYTFSHQNNRYFHMSEVDKVIEGLILIALDDTDFQFTLDEFIELCTGRDDAKAQLSKKVPNVARVLVEKLTEPQLYLLKKKLFAKEKMDDFLRGASGSTKLLKSLLIQEALRDENFRGLTQLFSDKFNKFQNPKLDEKPSEKPIWEAFLDELADLLGLDESVANAVRKRIGENKVDDDQPIYNEVVASIKEILAEQKITMTDEIVDKCNRALKHYSTFALPKEMIERLSTDLQDWLRQILKHFPKMVTENVSIIAAVSAGEEHKEILSRSMGYLFFTLISSYVLQPMLGEVSKNMDTRTKALLFEVFAQPLRGIVNGNYQSRYILKEYTDTFFRPVFNEFHVNILEKFNELIENSAIDGDVELSKFDEKNPNRELALDILGCVDKILNSSDKENSRADSRVKEVFLSGKFDLVDTYLKREAVVETSALREAVVGRRKVRFFLGEPEVVGGKNRVDAEPRESVELKMHCIPS